MRSCTGLDAAMEAVVAALPHLRAAVPRVAARPGDEPRAAGHGLSTGAGAPWASPLGSLRRGRETHRRCRGARAARGSGSRVRRDPATARRHTDASSRAAPAVRAARSRAGWRSLSGRCRSRRRPADPHGFLRSDEAARGNGPRGGWTLGPAQVFRHGAAAPIAATEEEIYAALGLPLIPAEIREGMDEIGAARAGRLPALVSRRHSRRSPHAHGMERRTRFSGSNGRGGSGAGI